jgi:broad specificity phosphatase PhoE
MARLLLVRHGQSVWNAESRWQGWADPPLSDLGESQAAALASKVAPAAFQAVVSSDLERARRTAVIVAEALGLAVGEEPGLRERDVGAWSGVTTSAIEKRWSAEMVAWRSGRLAAPPDGESDDTMAARVLPALGRLLDRPEDALLVITHGGVIRLVERRLGLEPCSTPNLSGRWVHRSGAGGSRPGGVGAGGVEADGVGVLAAGAAFLPDLETGGPALSLTHDTTRSR